LIDKHWLVSASKKLSNQTLLKLDEYFRLRWESLLAVDELVGDVVRNLDNSKQLENTYIIYTSDNGYHIGQFSQPFDKRQPYETDIKIPLLIRGPQIPKNVSISAPVSLIDIYPTIAEWIKEPLNNNLDGISFNAYLSNALFYNALNDKNYRRGILIQHWGEGNDQTYNPECPQTKNDQLAECTKDAECHCQDSWNNTYSCIRHFRNDINRLYCEFIDKEVSI